MDISFVCRGRMIQNSPDLTARSQHGMDLFDQDLSGDTPPKKAGPGPRAQTPRAAQPLAERMRPRSFEEWIGQAAVAGETSPLRRMIDQKMLPSLIFWGPPGCGKTTLAHLIAQETGLAFQALSAVTSGIKEVKEVIEQAA